MADSTEDFDLASLFVGPTALFSGVLGLADNARKTVGGVMETIASLQRAAKALETLVARIDGIVSEIEAPMRLLAPELEKATQRLLRVSEAFEGPLDRLIPGLEGAISSLDRVAISQLPDTLEAVQRQVLNVADTFRDMTKGFGPFGELFSFVLPKGRTGAGHVGSGVNSAKKDPAKQAPAKSPTKAPAKKAPTKAPAKSPTKATAKKAPAKKPQRPT